MLFNVSLTFLVAFLGGILFLRLKIPGAMIIGAAFATCILNLITPFAYMPLYGKLAAQICSGAFIACSVTRDDCVRIAKNWKGPFILTCGLFILNLITGTLLYVITGMDEITCYFSAIPGGISDTPIVAQELGGDSAIVLVAQLMRLVIGLSVFPLIASRIKSEERTIQNAYVKKRGNNAKKGFLHVSVTLLVAGVGGAVVRKMGVPAGALVGALIAVLVYSILSGKARMTQGLRCITQSLAGAYIGCSIGIDSIKLLIRNAPAMLLIGIMYTVGCFLISIVLHCSCKLTTRAALLAAMPAGVSDVALIAADMNLNIPELAVMQIVRLIMAITVFPHLILTLLNMGFPFFNM